MQFYVSLAESSDFAIKEMHILFSKKAIKMSHTRELSTRFLKKYKISDFQKFTISKEQFFKNTDQWMLVELKFKATGDENFFTIGNMNKNSKTEKRQRNRKNRQNISYYYIDHVQLTRMDQPIEIEKPKTVIKEIQLEESTFKLNSIYTLKSVLFDFDKATLIEETTQELDELVTFLKLHSDLKVTINGHTDYLGNAAYNQKLSEDRAKSVADYLINKEISKDRINYKGYGESQPIDPNEPEDAQAKNRRVEFVLRK